MEKVAYTPAEFAEVFGRERTWGYRQLYKGKVNAITELGRTLIPKSEVDRLLKEAGRYLGAKAKAVKDTTAKQEAAEGKKSSSQSWREAVKRRKEGTARADDSGSKNEKASAKGRSIKGDASDTQAKPKPNAGLMKFGRVARKA